MPITGMAIAEGLTKAGRIIAPLFIVALLVAAIFLGVATIRRRNKNPPVNPPANNPPIQPNSDFVALHNKPPQ